MVALPSWLDLLIGRRLRVLGTAVTRRTNLNFGTGFTLTDDPTNDQTTVTNTGGGGGGGGNLVVSTQSALKALVRADLTDGQSVTVKATNKVWIWSTASGAGFAGEDKTITQLTEGVTGDAGRFYINEGAPIVTTLAALRAAVAGIHDTIHVQAYGTAADGGGGVFDKVTGNGTGLDNDGTIVKPTGVTSFYYVRRFAGELRVEWFGIRGNDNQANATNNTARFNAMIAAQAGGFGAHIKFSKGIYWFNDQILIDRVPSLRIEGAGQGYVTVLQYCGADDATEAKAFLLVRRSAETHVSDMVIYAQKDATHRLGKCVHVTSAGTISLGESGPIHTTFQKVFIAGGIDVAFQIGSDTDVDVNTDRCSLVDCSVGNSRYGVRISNTNTNNFAVVRGSVETNTIAGIEIVNYPRGTMLDNVQMSNNTTMRQSVTFDAATDTFTKVNHGLRNNVTIELVEGTMPSGGNILKDTLADPHQYFIVNRTKDTFQIATTPNGAALLGGSNGSGLKYNCGADVVIRYTLGSGVEINGKQTELFYPYLKVEILAEGSVVLRNMLASYSLPASPAPEDVYKIIDFRGNGFFGLEDCQFYGSSTQLADSTAAIYVNPIANAGAGAHIFAPRNNTLFEGAVYSVRTTGNGAVRWIDLGTSYHATAGTTTPTQPHTRLHYPLQAMAQGKILNIDPLPAGLTIADVPLLGTKTVKYTITKELFIELAAATYIAIQTVGKFTRIKAVLAEVTEAFDGVTGPIMLSVGNTNGLPGLEAYLTLWDVGATGVRGKTVADVGVALYGGAAAPGGEAPSYSGNGQMAVYMTAGANIGSGTVTNLDHGSVDVYITYEEIIT